MKSNQVMLARWKQLRGKVKEEWGKLTHDDAARMQGRRDQMVGVVQEKYGSTIQKAQKNASHFFKKLNMH